MPEEALETTATLPPDRTMPDEVGVFRPALGDLHQDAFVRIELLDWQPVETENTEVFPVSWDGGSRSDGYGYLRFTVRQKSKLARSMAALGIEGRQGRGKTLRVHNLVAIFKTRQAIPRGWEVHHDDFNPLNNRSANLDVIYKGKHTEIHREVPRAGRAPDPGPLYLRVWFYTPFPVMRPPKNHGFQGRRSGVASFDRDLEHDVNRTIEAAVAARGITDPDDPAKRRGDDSPPPYETLPHEDCGDHAPHTGGILLGGASRVEQCFQKATYRQVIKGKALSRFGLDGARLAIADEIIKYLASEGFGSIAEFEGGVSLTLGSRATVFRVLKCMEEVQLIERVARGRYALGPAALRG